MKKFATAILMFELIAGLLFLGLWESRGEIPTAAGADVQADGTGTKNGGTVSDVPDAGSGENVTIEEVRKVAITFDDGPHPSYTEQLLDGLKERGVHATFFVTGEHAELHPDIIKRMQEDA